MRSFLFVVAPSLLILSAAACTGDLSYGKLKDSDTGVKSLDNKDEDTKEDDEEEEDTTEEEETTDPRVDSGTDDSDVVTTPTGSYSDTGSGGYYYDTGGYYYDTGGYYYDTGYYGGDTGSATCVDTCTWANDGECDDDTSPNFDGIDACGTNTDCSDCGSGGGSGSGTCNNTCAYSGDGWCDDSSSPNFEGYDWCSDGTDCDDCSQAPSVDTGYGYDTGWYYYDTGWYY